jgi:hypothetical protein
MFKVTQGRGFHIQFENGWTVSVQFGFGNYCDNYYRPEDFAQLFREKPGNKVENVSSGTAEIAAWDSAGNWYDFGDDVVKGYVAPDELLEYMSVIAALPPNS